MDDSRRPIDGSPKLTTSDYLRRWFNRFIFHTARTDQGVRNTFIPRENNDYRPHALRPRWISIYAAVIIVVKIVAVGFVSFYADRAEQSDVTPTNIVHLTNVARQSRNLSTLRSNTLLTKAAQAKANDMVQGHYFSHISPAKVTPWYWFKQAGYSYSYAGENLAIDYLQSEDVIQAWLSSASHRANLLSTKYKDIGVAVVTGNIEGADSLLVVQMFGAPLPKPTVRQVTAPPQTPAPSVAKAVLATTPPPPKPKPVVLGETTPPTPPVAPTIATPAPDSVVRTNLPAIIGQAEPDSSVTLMVDQQPNGTAIVSPNGVYNITPATPLVDKPVELTVESAARGVTSQPSQVTPVTVDTTPPTITINNTMALSSLVDPSAFNVWTETSPDAVNVQAAVGSTFSPLVNAGQHHYFGLVKVGPHSATGVISVIAVDPAGNETRSIVVDPDALSSGVVAPSSGIGVNALRAVFFSRRFFMIFIMIMLTMSLINIVVQVEHQHHPTIIATLLVVYLAGTLLFV